MRWEVVRRDSRFVKGAKITETVSGDGKVRRFTATIRGWRNWRMWEGPAGEAAAALPLVIQKVREIRDRIDAGDEEVFHESTIIQTEGAA